MATIADLVDRCRSAYEALAVLGEEIDDEWQYVTDLSGAWLAELDRVADELGGVEASSEVEAAIDWLSHEIGRIADPHRAIDWLSTFPQAVLLALAPEPPGGGDGS